MRNMGDKIRAMDNVALASWLAHIQGRIMNVKPDMDFDAAYSCWYGFLELPDAEGVKADMAISPVTATVEDLKRVADAVDSLQNLLKQIIDAASAASSKE